MGSGRDEVRGKERVEVKEWSKQIKTEIKSGVNDVGTNPEGLIV